MRTRLTVNAGAFGTLLLLTLVWAAPLAAQLTTAIPGTPTDLDVVTMVWNVGWVQQALETDARLFRSDAVLIPFGADLRLHTYGAFPAAVAWPVAYGAGVIAAYNVMLIGTVALNGCASYVLFRGLPTRPAAALAAAAALMLSGPVLDQMRVGRPIFASIWITCAAIVVARRLIARPTVCSGVALGALLVAALFTDFQMLLFTGLWLWLLAAWTIWRERGIDLPRAAAGLLALAILAVPFTAIFYPALAGAPAASIAAPSPAEAIVYSYRWWDYFTPSVMPRALGGYEMAIGLAAGLVMARREPRLRFWLMGAGVLLLLALGPKLQFTEIPLPFSLLSAWPPLAQFRSPSRLTIPAVIGIAAVAAVVLDRLLASKIWGRVYIHFLRAHRRDPKFADAEIEDSPDPVVWVETRLAALVVGAMLALRVGLAVIQHPLATQQYPAYDVYRRIADDGTGAALIEVPFGVRSGLERIGTGGESLQYYQHVHRRPIINAMVARLPHAVFEFCRSHQSLMFLAGEEVDASDQAISWDLELVLDMVGAGHVLVHRGMMEAVERLHVERVLDAHPRLERWVIEGDVLVYRVVASQPFLPH